jgi:hypothetical protein
MRISLKRQLSTLALAVGFVATIATTSIANPIHIRHRSGSAESTAGRGNRGAWNDSNYGYARVPFWASRHYYPNAFRGECTLDDGPFPCDSGP